MPVNAGDRRDTGLIPGWGRSPGGGHGNLLQYSCVENPMDRGAWRATVHGVAKSRTQLKRLSAHASEVCRSFLLQVSWKEARQPACWVMKSNENTHYMPGSILSTFWASFVIFIQKNLFPYHKNCITIPPTAAESIGLHQWWRVHWVFPMSVRS